MLTRKQSLPNQEIDEFYAILGQLKAGDSTQACGSQSEERKD